MSRWCSSDRMKTRFLGSTSVAPLRRATRTEVACDPPLRQDHMTGLCHNSVESDAIDLSQVRYFIAVARHGSFSAAAKALGITQPGLTKAVRRLEASLECMLFLQLPRGVELTQQGEALLRHASREFSCRMHARRCARSQAARSANSRIGAGPSWLGRALPRIIAELTAESRNSAFMS